MTLVLDHVSVGYPSSGRVATVLQDFDLAVEPGQIVSIVGPSGCGKSTLLHSAGGLLPPAQGQVTLNGRVVDRPIPDQISFVFQEYNLYPWRTVLDNAAIGLRFARVGKRERRARALECLRAVGMADQADRYPSQLSGGMQQRVAIARGLAMDPDVLLMDEPFGALDEQTRRGLGIDMSRALATAGKTVVLVTHSFDEALYWGDRVLVMSRRGTILDDLTVDEPRPRTPRFFTTPAFDAARARLWELMIDAGDNQPAQLPPVRPS